MSADLGGAADPGSCSALAARLGGTAYRLEALRRELGRQGGADLGRSLTELDAIVTDLTVLAEAVQRLAADLGEEHGPAGRRSGRAREQAAAMRRWCGPPGGSAQYRDAMRITETIDYAASPEQVFAMLRDEGFQDRKCLATGATEHRVTIDEQGDRTVVTSERSMPTEGLNLPSFANVGPALHVVEVQDWGPAGPDGGRTGRLSVELKGLPIRFTGTLSLAPGGRGASETIEGDLKANIPLFGGKAEKAAAPGILAGIRVEHETGEAWLAG